MQIDLEDLEKDFLNFKNEMQVKGRILVSEKINQIFQQIPDLEKICWRQYTPYFMDGDPCEFNVHDPMFFMKDDIFEDSDYEWRYWDQMPEESKELAHKIAKTICSEALSDVMQAVYGDGVEIYCTRDENGNASVTIEDYTDHE